MVVGSPNWDMYRIPVAESDNALSMECEVRGAEPVSGHLRIVET